MENSDQFISSVSQLAGALSENNRLLKEQAKATGADRPNQTIAPEPPSVQTQNKQAAFTNMDDSGNRTNVVKYWEVAKQILGPLLGGNQLPDAREENDGVASALQEQKAILEQGNLTSTATSNMLEKMAEGTAKKTDIGGPRKQEKTVVKQATRVIVSDLDSKAHKKFGGLFKSLKGMLGLGQKKEESVKKEDGGMGILGMLGMLAIGGLALILMPVLGPLIAGLALLLAPLLAPLALIVAGIVGIVAVFKTAVAVGKLAWKGLKLAGEGIAKVAKWGWGKLKDGWKWFRKTFTFDNMKKGWDKLGKFASEKWKAFKTGVKNLGETVSKKFTKAVDYVKNSKIGKGVSNLMSGISKTVSGALDSIKNSKIGKAVGGFFSKITGVFKKKPPGVEKAAAKTAAKISGNVLDATGKAVPKGGKLLGMVGKVAKFAGPIGALVSGGMAVFDGVGAAMDEYKKSGSILSAAKEGVSAGLSSLTFGLVDQETFSGIFTSIGDGISGAASFVGDAVSAGWDAAKGVVGKAGDLLSGAGKSLSKGASKVWGSIKGFFSNSPDVWDVLDESGKKLGEGAQKVSVASEKTAGGMTESFKELMMKHPLARLGGLAVDGYKSMFSTVKGWFSSGKEETAKEGKKTASSGKELLHEQIDAIHGLTASIVEVIDERGPGVRNAAISMMETAREYFESAEAEIGEGGPATGPTSSGGDKDSMRAAAINNRERSSAVVTGSGFDKRDRTSVDPKTGKLRTFDHTFFGGREYRDLTDEEMAKFDKKHNIAAMSKAAPKPMSKASPKPTVPAPSDLASKRLSLPNPTTGLVTNAVADKLAELITVASDQLKELRLASKASAAAADQIKQLAEKSKGNTVVNTNNNSTSVINNSDSLTNYRAMSNI
jgi:hypothetical protein